jgi:SAM-dependent methyltransferase
VINGDMRSLPFEAETFDFTLLMFTSFGYFSKPEEDLQVLQEVHKTLVDCGQFLMDLSNFHRITKNFLSTRELKLEGGEIIKYTKRIEEGVLVEERVIDTHGNITELDPMKLRIYLVDDVREICTKAGFKNIELTDENLNSFDSDTSRRLWVMCQK